MENQKPKRGRRKDDKGKKIAFGQRLSKLFVDNDKTYTDLANYIKENTGETMTRQSIGQWCDGNTNPRAIYIPLIAGFFNVTTEYLLSSTDEKTETEIQTTYLRSLVVVLTDESTEFETYDNQTGEITIRNSQTTQFIMKCKGLLEAYRNGVLTKEMYESCVKCAIREVTKEGDNNDVE